MQNQKGFILPILIIISLLILAVVAYFFSPKSISMPVPTDLPTAYVYPTTTPTESKQPDVVVTAEPVVYQTLTFYRPSDWSLWGDQQNRFSFAYDANKYFDPEQIKNELSLVSSGGNEVIVITDVGYDGGSRHKLISSFYKFGKKSNYVEKNYIINGKNSLFLYNTSYPNYCTLGAIFIDATNAKLFKTQICDISKLETFLSTIKF